MVQRPPGHPPVEMQAALKARPDAEDAPSNAMRPDSLFESHFSFVWRNLRRLGVGESNLEDAAQDVFLVVHRRWSSFDPSRSAVETWLYGIILRVAHNHRRSLARMLARIVPWSDRSEERPAAIEDPSETVAKREAVALFERAIQGFAPDKRAVFLMVEVEGMTVPQAAEALRINENTAYWRLREARLAFKKSLARVRAVRVRMEEIP